MKHLCCFAIGLLLLATPTLVAQPAIDGSADETLYGAALVTQDTQTGFGDASLGRPDVCDGSELDEAYGVIYNGTLYLVLAGNLQTNGNKLEIFFDTRAGGQNRLLSTNPGPAGGLLRMSDDGNGNGLTFQTGFEADFWVSVNLFGDPVGLYVDYAELYVDAMNPGVAYYCGAGATKCETVGGGLTGGDVGAPVILATADNSNISGVTGGYGGGDGSGVLTGVELAIPLAALGNPAGAFTVTAFINGQQHDFVSNQALGGFSGLIADNPGEPRAVDFSTLGFGVQAPFTVPAAPVPTGACCVGTACSIKTAAQCTASSGTYLGDNTNCDGNPCDATPQGRCCIDDGYSGICMITTSAGCSGTWAGAGTTCEGCPCLLAPTGACCIAGVCSLQTEADCIANTGAYVGNYTNCNGDNPCDSGACCRDLVCTVEMRFQCPTNGGQFVGAGTDCSANPCAAPTLPNPHVTGDWLGWNPADPNQVMTETAPGSRIFTKDYTGFAAGEYHQFKVTNGVDWANSRPTSGNCWFLADATGNVTITYDANYYADGWLPARDRFPFPAFADPGVWTGVGDWQDGLPGYMGGVDWNNSDATTVMTAQGGGIYKVERTGLGVGSYIGKGTRTSTWDAMGANGRSTDASNLSFDIAATTDTMKIWVDALKGVAKVEVVPAATFCHGDLDCDGSIGFSDINPFVLYLSNNAAWQATYPCSLENGDINGDGTYPDFGDINPFVSLLSTQPPPTCPQAWPEGVSIQRAPGRVARRRLQESESRKQEDTG